MFWHLKDDDLLLNNDDLYHSVRCRAWLWAGSRRTSAPRRSFPFSYNHTKNDGFYTENHWILHRKSLDFTLKMMNSRRRAERVGSGEAAAGRIKKQNVMFLKCRIL